MQVTSNNIANANTPGYARQVVHLGEAASVVVGNLAFGTGVSIDDVETVRNDVLTLRIQQETQSQGQTNAFLDGANQVQQLFNETQGVGLQSELSKFFNSLSQLSTDPTNMTLRQTVLNNAQTLADGFHQTASGLNQIKNAQDQTVIQAVGQVNQLAKQIALLNGNIQQVRAGGADTGELQGQRDQVIQQLSNLVGVSVTKESDGSVDVTTANGQALVVGNQPNALSTSYDAASGTQHVFAGSTDITSNIFGGQLGGAIQVRDEFVPSVAGQLDDLAANLSSAFNTQHALGFTPAGVQGGSFFTPFTQSTPGSNTGAAADFGVFITDPAQIAASSDKTAPGSNGNALALAAVQKQALVGGQNAMDYYANMVSNIGSGVANATGDQEATGLVLNQLTTQQANYSGVSLDEEATNLVKYQNAYNAAARMITTVNQMMQTAINMVS